APLAPGFVPAEEIGDGRTLILNKVETIEHFDFVLMRGAVITGKVVDTDGRPVIETEVQIYSALNGNRLFQGGLAQTDDRGIYRAYGLRPGSYRVAVGHGDEASSASGMYQSVFYRRVFYPSTSDPAQATVLELSEGSEANNIDITLGRSINTFTASGRMIDGETGQPVANVSYGLIHFVTPNHQSSMSN